MCTVDMSKAMSSTPVPQTWRSGKTLYIWVRLRGMQSLPLALLRMLRMCAKSIPSNFLYTDVYSLKLFAGRDPLLRPANSPLCHYPHPHYRLVVPGGHIYLFHQSSHPLSSLALLYVCPCICPFFNPLPPHSGFQAQAVLDQHLGTEMLTPHASLVTLGLLTSDCSLTLTQHTPTSPVFGFPLC